MGRKECVWRGGYFLNESRGLSCLRTPCLVANTNNNRTIPHHGNYVCPGWHEFTMQIWGGVIFFWESISMTATNTPAPLLSTWPEHPLIIYCHILRQKFSCLLFSHLSHSHSSALFRFPTQPVFPVILFVWVSTVFLSDAVIVAPSPLSSSRNPYIQNKWEIKWNIIENIIYIKSSSLLWEGQILSVVFLFITVD